MPDLQTQATRLGSCHDPLYGCSMADGMTPPLTHPVRPLDIRRASHRPLRARYQPYEHRLLDAKDGDGSCGYVERQTHGASTLKRESSLGFALKDIGNPPIMASKLQRLEAYSAIGRLVPGNRPKCGQRDRR